MVAVVAIETVFVLLCLEVMAGSAAELTERDRTGKARQGQAGGRQVSIL
jgi:hypothetical protein